MKDINNILQPMRKYLIGILVLLLLFIFVFIPLVTKQDREIYAYSTDLYKKYEQDAHELNDANPNDDVHIRGERLVQAEKRAIRETAEKFNITETEVIRIISDLQ